MRPSTAANPAPPQLPFVHRALRAHQLLPTFVQQQPTSRRFRVLPMS